MRRRSWRQKAISRVRLSQRPANSASWSRSIRPSHFLQGEELVSREKLVGSVLSFQFSFLVTLHYKHLLAISLSEFSRTFRIKMQAVVARATRRRNDVRIWKGFGQVRHDFIEARALPLLIGIHGFTRQQKHLGLEIQVLDQIIVNTLHFIRPFLIAGI